MNVQNEFEKIKSYLDNAVGWGNIDPQTKDYVKERFQLLFTLVNQKQQENELLNADKELLQSKWEAQGMMIQKFHEEQKGLNYNELYQFMQEFGVDYINMYGELIIDEKTNAYTFITSCRDIEDVKTRVISALCRPIGKGLEKRDAFRLLKRVNDYFKTELTKDDMLLMYQELCYERKLPEFKDFIKRGFPMDELRKGNENV